MNCRIFARWVDDPLETPVTLDAALGLTRRIAGDWILFGATGLHTPQCLPFTLDAEGRMDFGAGRAEADRFWRTDIRTREIALGAKFDVTWSGGDSGVYRIEKIYVPGRKTGA